MNVFSKRLRETRKACNLTQEELAEKADISRVMISRYETESVIPTVEVLVYLADALDVSIDYLLGRVEKSDQLYGSSRVCNTGTPEIKGCMPKNEAELRQFILSVLSEIGILNEK